MSGTTTNEGYPYPLESDFADVQDIYRLAMAVDSDVRGAQAPFRLFEQRPSFIVQSSSNSSSFLSGDTSMTFGTIKWDNTGGLTVGQTSWQQPISSPPSWWMFGATILEVPISGTPVVGEMTMGQIRINTTDQVSGLTTEIDAYQRNDDSNTGGEWINVFTQAAVYRASVSLILNLNGTTQKALGAGSTLWGFQLGPVL